MRLRISDPELLSELCDYLSREGCLAVEAGDDAADVLVPAAASSFEAATWLLGKVGLWRARRAGVTVTIDMET